MQRPTREARGPAARPSADSDRFLQLYPRLSERLTTDRWDDGGVRETDTLFLFFDGERFKAMLKDRDAASVAFVSAETVDGVFAALEAGLATSALDWRADRQASKKKK